MSDNPWTTHRDVIGDIFSALNTAFGNAKKGSDPRFQEPEIVKSQDLTVGKVEK